MRRMKLYDRRYFDRWYRDDGTRIHVKGQLERKVHFALHAAEQLMERPVQSVLDIGCGEAPWQPVLHALRPGIRYAGVDSSTYAVKRFGRKRNIRLGTFGELPALGLDGPFDLTVCADMLHYVPTPELQPGLDELADLLGGMAFIEVFTSADQIEGDLKDMVKRSPAVYDRAFRRAGLVHCGLYCFVRDGFAPGLATYERGRANRREAGPR